MATKTVTIVRYTPPNELVGRRILRKQDFKNEGILTQKKDVVWTREGKWWVDADEAGISAEALEWLENKENHGHKGEFKVERQEVETEDELDEGAENTESPLNANTAEPTTSGSSTTTGGSTTTESTGATRGGTRGSARGRNTT